jgi:hypothetical protein
LFVTDIGVHKKFWTEVMGGTFVTNGPLRMIDTFGDSNGKLELLSGV